MEPARGCRGGREGEAEVAVRVAVEVEVVAGVGQFGNLQLARSVEFDSKLFKSSNRLCRGVSAAPLSPPFYWLRCLSLSLGAYIRIASAQLTARQSAKHFINNNNNNSHN